MAEIKVQQQVDGVVTVRQLPSIIITRKQTLLLPPAFINYLLLANGFSHLFLSNGDSKLKIIG